MLEKGIKGESKVAVTEDNVASKLGNEGMDVYSTPDLIGLMEMTCKRSVDSYLEPGQGTVGVKVDVQHMAATPIGMTITCRSVLKSVDRNKLVFEVEAFDDVEQVGKGEHQRFIVSTEKFIDGINKKKEKI